jgi:hypothetical protein
MGAHKVSKKMMHGILENKTPHIYGHFFKKYPMGFYVL